MTGPGNKAAAESMEPTLCMPDAEKSCFACCPPIRPAGYEHIRFEGSVRRMLRDNTREFPRTGGRTRPIIGFSCWALGYVSGYSGRVGCLLHPARNGGVDLRYRVEYGGKCAREHCPGAVTFAGLPVEVRRFWLRLTGGMNSFAYSSPTLNPLFRLTGWGETLLTGIASEGMNGDFTVASLLEAYPFFATGLNPRGNRYLLDAIIAQASLVPLRSRGFRRRFEALSAATARSFGDRADGASGGPTHLLGGDAGFLDFLRLSAGARRVDEARAWAFKEELDRALEAFVHGMSGGKR